MKIIVLVFLVLLSACSFNARLIDINSEELDNIKPSDAVLHIPCQATYIKIDGNDTDMTHGVDLYCTPLKGRTGTFVSLPEGKHVIEHNILEIRGQITRTLSKELTHEFNFESGKCYALYGSGLTWRIEEVDCANNWIYKKLPLFNKQ